MLPKTNTMPINMTCICLAKRYVVSKLNAVPRRGGLPEARLKRVLEYIDANLDKNITLSELAGVVQHELELFCRAIQTELRPEPAPICSQQACRAC